MACNPEKATSQSIWIFSVLASLIFAMLVATLLQRVKTAAITGVCKTFSGKNNLLTAFFLI